MSLTVGLVHPGSMGSAVGSSWKALGHRVVWASDGRSLESRTRAEEAGLEDVHTVADVVEVADVIVSVVPPHAAADVAREVAGPGVVLIDANAVSPDVARQISETITAAGGTYVDGSIIGSPPRSPGRTRLFLSGDAAPDWVGRLGGGLLEPVAIDGGAHAASALKMAYAAWTKGTDALLLATVATAEHHGVREALVAEWARSQPQLVERVAKAAASTSRKGWRWDGEMQQVAETFSAAGLPTGFHNAAADVFSRVPRDEDARPDGDTVESVIRTLTAGS